MHIHVLNAEPPLALSVDELFARIARTGIDPKTLRITESLSAALPTGIGDPEILFSCHAIDLGAAREAYPSLRWVQAISAGVEKFKPDAERRITLTNASGVHGAKGAEFVLAAVLMLNYAIPAFLDDQRLRRWQPVFGGTVAGKTCTLLGVGGIGREVAATLRGRGIRVIGVTRSGHSDVPLDRCIATSELDTVLEETDFLVSTLPSTPETRRLMDRRRLSLLPKGAGVVVVGRADVFDDEALGALLETAHLGGAVLDVFPVEPLPVEHPLWNTPRLIMTPHCSLDDHSNYIQGCLEIFVDNLGRWQCGEALKNRVDFDLGY